ncbi:low temperature requirement protein LtrA [Micromonospora kangleipakensis]|uniref:Low temperature requirement protein LtrA n=1 Tax=Micromonospora kangleipakensis TaxID=1077942 RepID=A0A4Q8B3V6_9ACTN|nr:low temperature requirement protein A [Micromonospora kangleipakensis]RZU72214.1 low temperature requirement protein LtrA [Micromonospora kangleipakensis]
MTTSGTNGLLRKLEDVARASFLELFFDVVFVFALRALAQQLFNNLTWSGAFRTLVLLLAIGWVWSLTARVTGQLNPRRPSVQLLVLATMVGALVLSAAVPEAFGKTGLIFAVTYLAIQIGRDLFLVVLLRGQELQHVAGRATIWHAATGVPWLIGAVASGTVRTALWTLAVVLIYVARWFSYPLPGLRRLAGGDLPPGGEYLADRNRALFVIALGEVILAIGSSLTGRGFSTDQTVAFVMTFAVTALIWRIYIFRAGEDMGPAIQASANPDRLSKLVSYAHLVMIAGLVVTSVGNELVIDDPFGHPRATATVTILGGTALFLAGRTLLGYLVFGRVYRSCVIGLLALACLLPPMLLLGPLVNALASATVLTGIVITDNIRVRRHPAPISPPGPHRPSET